MNIGHCNCARSRQVVIQTLVVQVMSCVGLWTKTPETFVTVQGRGKPFVRIVQPAHTAYERQVGSQQDDLTKAVQSTGTYEVCVCFLYKQIFVYTDTNI